MDILNKLIGTGDKLTLFQMGSRAIIVFILTLITIRISGKRSFGMRSPLDNVISILLGTLFGNAIIGSSPFIPTITAGFILAVVFHIFARLTVRSHGFGKIVKGEKTVIYENGKIIRENMDRCMVTDKDLYEEIRLNANVDSLEEIKSAYVERNGTISVVKN